MALNVLVVWAAAGVVHGNSLRCERVARRPAAAIFPTWRMRGRLIISEGATDEGVAPTREQWSCRPRRHGRARPVIKPLARRDLVQGGLIAHARHFLSHTSSSFYIDVSKVHESHEYSGKSVLHSSDGLRRVLCVRRDKHLDPAFAGSWAIRGVAARGARTQRRHARRISLRRGRQ